MDINCTPVIIKNRPAIGSLSGNLKNKIKPLSAKMNVIETKLLVANREFKFKSPKAQSVK
jgi:hypothetical protein